MEFRKLISFGKSSYVVSLPKDWIEYNKLRKGDSIKLEQEAGNLVLMSSAEERKSEEVVEIDVTNLDSSSILHLMQAWYKKGVDDIKINYSQPETIDFKTGKKAKVSDIIKRTVARLIGFEVVYQKEKSCTVKSISSISAEEFDNILRRVFLLLTDMAKDLVEGVETSNMELLRSVEERHENITRFIAYCLRILNKKYKETHKVPFLFHIIASLDKITDVYKYIAREVADQNKKLKEETILILKGGMNSLNTYYELFYKFDNQKLVELSRNRRDLRKKVQSLEGKMTPFEIFVCSQVIVTLDILLDLTEARIAMQ